MMTYTFFWMQAFCKRLKREIVAEKAAFLAERGATVVATAFDAAEPGGMVMS
jgi:hypothetical protein